MINIPNHSDTSCVVSQLRFSLAGASGGLLMMDDWLINAELVDPYPVHRVRHVSLFHHTHIYNPDEVSRRRPTRRKSTSYFSLISCAWLTRSALRWGPLGRLGP